MLVGFLVARTPSIRARGRFEESAQWIRVLETMPLRNLLRTVRYQLRQGEFGCTERVLGLGQD
jgi:hypothetical protein